MRIEKLFGFWILILKIYEISWKKKFLYIFFYVLFFGWQGKNINIGLYGIWFDYISDWWILVYMVGYSLVLLMYILIL